jgi:hypothetical protein
MNPNFHLAHKNLYFLQMTTALKEKLPTEKLNLNFLGNKNTQKLNNDEEIIPHLFGVDECKQTSMSKFKNQVSQEFIVGPKSYEKFFK